MPDATETLAALLRRHSGDDQDEPRDVPRVSLAEALRTGTDPLRILAYLAGLGLEVRSLDDLLLINGDDTEEELHAFRVAEGVAISIASEGLPASGRMTVPIQSTCASGFSVTRPCKNGVSSPSLVATQACANSWGTVNIQNIRTCTSAGAKLVGILFQSTRYCKNALGAI